MLNLKYIPVYLAIGSMSISLLNRGYQAFVEMYNIWINLI